MNLTHSQKKSDTGPIKVRLFCFLYYRFNQKLGHLDLPELFTFLNQFANCSEWDVKVQCCHMLRCKY